MRVAHPRRHRRITPRTTPRKPGQPPSDNPSWATLTRVFSIQDDISHNHEGQDIEDALGISRTANDEIDNNETVAMISTADALGEQKHDGTEAAVEAGSHDDGGDAGDTTKNIDDLDGAHNNVDDNDPRRGADANGDEYEHGNRTAKR